MKPVKVHNVTVEIKIRTTYKFNQWGDVDSMNDLPEVVGQMMNMS